MRLTRHSYNTRKEKIIDFAIGFIGMIVVNALMFGAVFYVTPRLGSTGSAAIIALVLTLLPFFINIGGLIFFGFTRHWIAIGALGVFAAGFLLYCIALLFIAIACFVGLATSSFR